METNNENLGFYSKLFEEDDLYLIGKQPDLKPICIILDVKLSAKNESFLNNVLSAVRLSLSTISILYSSNIESYKDLQTEKVLIFDGFPLLLVLWGEKLIVQILRDA